MSGRDDRAAAAAWLADHGTAALSDAALARLGDEIDGALIAAVPELAADESLRGDLRSSTREILRVFFSALARDTDEEYETPPEARDLARAFARRRLDLAVLLRVYRVGQDLVWRRMMEKVWNEVRDEQLARAILRRVWEQLTRRLDTSLGALVATYTEERERGLRGALARRAEMVDAILRDQEPVDLESAEAALAYPLRRQHTAFALWAGDTRTEPAALLEEQAAALADALGGSRALVVPVGASALWAWVASDREPSAEQLHALAVRPGVRLAAGTPAYGLAGFRRSHHEALRAQRVASGGEAPLTLYDDVALVALVAEDAETMQALLARELGALAERDAASAKLRATALAYLRAGGNARLAAQVLGTHKNTVIYRVSRIEELLGRPLGERRANLEVALAVVEALGDEVLETG